MRLMNIVLGTWSWGVGSAGGDQVFGNHLGATNLREVFDAAMSEGMNFWDTALVYGMGSSEDILSSFTRPLPRESYRISTKFTPQIADVNAENPVASMLESSLNRFNIDYVDYYWIHNPENVEKWTPMLIPLVKSGKIKRVGVSNHNLKQIKRASEILAAENISLSGIQNHFSLLYRSSEKGEILEWCKKEKIDFWAYMTLEQGALSGKYDSAHLMPAGSMRGPTYNPILAKIDKLLDIMREIGHSHEASPAQIAMAWVVNKGAVPIIGVTKKSQVHDARKALGINLSPNEMTRLENAAASLNVDVRGSWEEPMA